jgi:hypothetical protein
VLAGQQKEFATVVPVRPDGRRRSYLNENARQLKQKLALDFGATAQKCVLMGDRD